MIDWIQLDKDDLNCMQFRLAKLEEKGILMELLALAMVDTIELPFDEADKIIDYTDLAQLLQTTPVLIANTIRRFSKLLSIEIGDGIAVLKFKPVETAKDKLTEATDKGKKAANTRWDKAARELKEKRLRKSEDAQALHVQCTSNANPMPLDQIRSEYKAHSAKKHLEKKEDVSTFFLELDPSIQKDKLGALACAFDEEVIEKGWRTRNNEAISSRTGFAKWWLSENKDRVNPPAPPVKKEPSAAHLRGLEVEAKMREMWGTPDESWRLAHAR